MRFVILFLLIHICVCVLVWLLMEAGVMRASRMILTCVVFVPVWGLACLFFLELRTRGKGEINEQVGIEKLKINDEIYRSILVEEDPMENKVVPIEEALVINPPVTRRELMMEVMYGGAEEYVEQLEKASLNDDTEVVHYAVTALSELQKEYDLAFQDLERRMEEKQDPEAALEEYLELLEKYFRSGLPKGEEKTLRLGVYSRLLGEKIQAEGISFPLCARKARADLERGAYEETAVEAARLLREWPRKEEGYLIRIQCCAAFRDTAGIHETIRLARERSVHFSQKGKETIRFWEEEGR